MLLVFNLIFIAFISGIIIFIREYRKKRKAHLVELETNKRLHKEELLLTQNEIQKETMSYIGREIHDNIGQKLTLSSIYLQQLAEDQESPAIQQPILQINEIINESLIELRKLSKSLTDNATEAYSISELIQKECDKINALKLIKVHFENRSDNQLKSYQSKTILLRIVQEFFQNSIKHSNCSKINVLLQDSDSELDLTIADDGVGFNKNLDYSGIGLKNVAKRIELLKGQSELISNSSGTQLNIRIPLA